MGTRKRHAAVLSLLLIAAPVTTPAGVDIDRLFQHWVHSSEEEAHGQTGQVFRPASSKEFPPSRFRMAYKFARNGSCECYVLSPDDGHHFEPCTWSVSGSDKARLLISHAGTTTTFKIVELSGKILRLEPVP